jgi:hypothetical protein
VSGAGENDYRQALRLAERALMHAEKLSASPTWQVRDLIQEARAEVSRVLDIGRDEANEMVAT